MTSNLAGKLAGKFMVAIMVVGLAGCASSFKSDVSSWHQLPRPSGESFVIIAKDEAKQATEAAYHAQAAAQGAQAEAEHERKRSSEVQLRCLQLEQQLASLGSEALTLQNLADEREIQLKKWQDSAISPDDRGSIVSALLALVKGYWLCFFWSPNSLRQRRT